MCLIGFKSFVIVWLYFVLPQGKTMSCEEAMGQISNKIEQLHHCDEQIVTHLSDLIQDIHSISDNMKDHADPSFSGCKQPANGSISNGQIKQAVDWMGKGMLWFKCNEGFVLQGSPVLVCRDNAWNDSIPACIAKDCMAHQSAGQVKDGVYGIIPDGQTQRLVYCDMTTDGGGWTVFQRRVDDSVNFYRNYHEYQEGFGDPEGNIWLGFDMVYVLTEFDSELFVDMTKNETHNAFARYNSFSLADETDGYRLSVSGYSGTAGDSLAYHDGQRFSTYDRDQGPTSHNCANSSQGAWWYNNCYFSNLNGMYLNGSYTTHGHGINWGTFSGPYYSLNQVEMKMRRKI